MGWLVRHISVVVLGEGWKRNAWERLRSAFYNVEMKSGESIIDGSRRTIGDRLERFCTCVGDSGRATSALKASRSSLRVVSKNSEINRY